MLAFSMKTGNTGRPMTSPLEIFQPAVREWFAERFEAPTRTQELGWPAIARAEHVLIAAPTGTGKTLTAFLWALDSLLSSGAGLADETRILYVSPLRALGNDVKKNLDAPLAELRERHPELPEVRVLVRTGDTTAADRAAMRRRAPHVLVTTPESLYILLSTESGRSMLRTVKTVIVDEIHAVAQDKRGSHLALSLERLAHLAGEPQRIGLSATQKPLDAVASLLVGAGRECHVVDAGHMRAFDLEVEVPPVPLESVCSHETWGRIYERMAELIRAHRSTLVFVNTRKIAERVASHLSKIVGEDRVACHHSSLAKDRRLDAEQRLKEGRLSALVATASLELGIDVGDVDLAIQVGTTRSIATFLQRLGRAGHSVHRVPKGRILPLTLEDLVESGALLRAIHGRRLDALRPAPAALDILAQQVVSACLGGAFGEEELYALSCRAWPYRALERRDFDAAVSLHTQGRHALLHRDGVGRRLMATKRARLVAVMSGGAIPDNADYRVVADPEGTPVGTINEDFAVESSAGDIFQLGNTSWQITKVERGTVRVVDVKGAPPTIPFWLGEGPSRTRELCEEIGLLREAVAAGVETAMPGWPAAADEEVRGQISAGAAALGAVPSQRRVILERFFDESGGMQLVLHAPYGGRVMRAWGLALRKRFCRGFGFELQAAASDDAIVISLGPQHSFPLDDIFDYLHPNTVESVLTQALLPTPMFTARWRWNATRSLVLARHEKGKRVPPPLLRMRADDLLVKAFPAVMACGETLPPGDLEVPMDHPLVRQTIDDCLREAMDVDGLIEILKGLRSGAIEKIAVDLAEPSPFAKGAMNLAPFAFLDDAPLEERRTQAVLSRRILSAADAAEIGALDPEAVERVRREAWPACESAEELHEALGWMGYCTTDEARDSAFEDHLADLATAGRVQREGDRWFATEATRDPVAVLRGRLEATAYCPIDTPHAAELEREGIVLRAQIGGASVFCERRLLARMRRYTIDTLQRQIAPVSAADFVAFLAAWQHVEESSRLDGPAGVASVLAQASGFEAPAAAWEKEIIGRRINGYRRDWLDQVTLSGEFVWLRLFGASRCALKVTPLTFVPRVELDAWLAVSPPPDLCALGSPARALRDVLATKGAMFAQELSRAARLLPDHFDTGLGELISHGLVSADSFGALRRLLVPPSRRARNGVAAIPLPGRWSLIDRETPRERDLMPIVRSLLGRWGIVMHKLLAREKLQVPWRDLVRVLRLLELRGEVLGGRFVQGLGGEHFALPAAVELLRRRRRERATVKTEVSSVDPLHLSGIILPGDRGVTGLRRSVTIGG